MKFAVKVTQQLATTVIIDGVASMNKAIALAKKYDEQTGIDPQEIEHVEFDIVDIPDDPYAPVITPDDVV